MKAKHIGIIKHFENLELKAYLCPAGVWTIGWGHTKGVKKGDKINQRQAVKLLKEDLTSAEMSVEQLVKVDLNQHQFDALVSFVFNLGHGNFAESTLLKKLNKGDYLGAANEFQRWVFSNGEKLNGLVHRRDDEALLFIGVVKHG